MFRSVAIWQAGTDAISRFHSEKGSLGITHSKRAGLSRLYGKFATLIAYLIANDGKIAAEVAVGSSAGAGPLKAAGIMCL